MWTKIIYNKIFKIKINIKFAISLLTIVSLLTIQTAAYGSIKKITAPTNSIIPEKNTLADLQEIKTDSYKIGPGDIFNIFIYEEEELNTEGALVKPDGRLSLKLLGEVKVDKKTITEAEKIIEKDLKTYLKFPRATLIPIELHSAQFTIIGKVNKPGSYLISNNSRILDAIAKAEGFTTGIFQNNTIEMANLEHAYISRSGEILPVNFHELIQKGNMIHNIPLQDGDYIYIPSAMNREVYVIGEVKSPGFFGYKENLTLMQILARAKGFKDTATTQIIIVRGSFKNPTIYSINYPDILEGKIQDMKLEPEDIVFVPKSHLGDWNKILNLVLPSIEAIQTGLILQNTVSR
jgi:polysaccharide biosynthesis/export protein